MPLEVRIDVIPFGNESWRYNLDTIRITNIRPTEEHLVADYVVELNGYTATIRAFSRSEGALVLVQTSIEAIRKVMYRTEEERRTPE